MLEASGLSFAYGAHKVLREVSLSVKRGEMTALLGPNGAGKSTLLKILGGLLPPRSGAVLLEGRPLADWGRRRLAAALSIVTQDVDRQAPFSVREVVEMGRTPHVSLLGRLKREDHEWVARALELTELDALASRPIGELSSGEFQRTLLALSLAQDTPWILLDEPTAFLDIRHRLGTLQLLRRLNRDLGRSVIAVIHDLDLAAAFFDRLVLLRAGRVAAHGAPEEVLTPEILREVFGVEASVFRSPGEGSLRVDLKLW